MKRKQITIAIISGLLVGQIFAEGENPYKISNSLRIGYNDNVYRNAINEQESAYIEDIIDLSYNAALTDQTALTFGSRFRFMSDKEQNLYPSIYASLNHSVSPRLVLMLSDKFVRDARTSSQISGRYDYYRNTLSFVPSYIFSLKDSLSVPIDYTIQRNETALENDDFDMITAGLSWKRELNPQKTWVAFDINRANVDYINRSDTYDATRAFSKLTHAFNPKLIGDVTVGVSYDEADIGNQTSDSTSPYLGAGLTFAPSSDTRLTANVSRRTQESSSSLYANQTSSSLQLGLEHDITARINGKFMASFTKAEYDADNGVPGAVDDTQDYMDLSLRFKYKINRINSLECGVRHREAAYDATVNDWNQNMVDVGWRVEL